MTDPTSSDEIGPPDPPPFRPPNTYEEQQAVEEARQVRMLAALERIAEALEFFVLREHQR